jgi:hypothetical protein
MILQVLSMPQKMDWFNDTHLFGVDGRDYLPYVYAT